MDDFNDSYIEIIPVDPHRFFALWTVSPELLQRAEDAVGIPPSEGAWFIRAFRLADSEHELHEALSVEDFPIITASRQSYFTVGSPGGFVFAVIGVKDRRGRFYPLLSAPRVALPEAPEVVAGTQLPALDEKRVLEAAGTEALPEELRLPAEAAGGESTDSPRDPIPGLPETMALNEEKIVATALRDMASAAESRANESQAESGAQRNPSQKTRSTHSGSRASDRLASQFDEEEIGAPLVLRAIVVVEGIVQPGLRLLIDGIEVEQRMDGRFTWKRPLVDFPLLWSLLSEIPTEYSIETPMGSAFSRWFLRALIDIEGVVGDPDYFSLLPQGVVPDAAGRIRLIREIAPDAPFLPRIEAVPSLD